jgi:protocatechuate 3,4-dioxygenase beta subunit
MAGELPLTSAVRIHQRLGRKELRFQWSQSQALVVAFIEIKPETDFEKALAPLIRDAARLVEPRKAKPESSLDLGLTRRSALIAIGSIGMGAFLAACARAAGNGTTATTASHGTTSGSSTSAVGTATTGATAAIDCVLLPEMTAGPYYLDLDLVRSDITEDRVGAPLALTIIVADANTCTPIQDAAVDLWHCDAEGIYSGFIAASTGQGSGTDDTAFLRGTQITDASGAATFQTLYPGWYQGRTVHMHMKVHVGGNQIHTTQLFFDDTFTDQVYAANEPYASRNDRDMLNSEDGIYSGGGDATTLNVTESGDGYAATLTVGVQI